tara:strand:- start:65 stop:310 length:246 start_codon:yes stop_codon:yes gene_type:complete
MKKREQLEKLQVLLADVYKESILEMRDSGEYNAALLNGARQLLKDNDVISVTEKTTPLGNLAEVLPFDASDDEKEMIRQSN